MAISIAGAGISPKMPELTDKNPQSDLEDTSAVASLMGKGFLGAGALTALVGVGTYGIRTGFKTALRNEYCDKLRFGTKLTAVVATGYAAAAAGIAGATMGIESLVFGDKQSHILEKVVGVGFFATMLVPISAGAFLFGVFEKIFNEDLRAYVGGCFPKTTKPVAEQSVAESDTSSQRVATHEWTNPLKAMGHSPIALPKISGADVAAIARANSRTQELRKKALNTAGEMAILSAWMAALRSGVAEAAVAYMTRALPIFALPPERSSDPTI